MFTYSSIAGNPFRTVALLAKQLLRNSAQISQNGWMPDDSEAKNQPVMTFSSAWMRPVSWLVPIRELNPWHKPKIEAHLLGLTPGDRYLRFGYAASDEQVCRYVADIDFQRDDVFGIYNRKLQLVAMAHLARSTDEKHTVCAEFGVSVLASARGRGYGARLFDRAVMHARNHRVQLLFIHALSENKPMLSIARKSGATVERDGPESNAYLKLPEPDMEGMVQEMVEEQIAQTDYWLKAQAKDFRAWLDQVKHGRLG
jgi:GNAT superfamily N-acetyltransferase